MGLVVPLELIITRIILLFIIIISGICSIAVVKIKDNRRIIYWWTALLLLNLVGYALSGEYSNNYVSQMFTNVIVCLITFYPFYYSAYMGYLKRKHLLYFMFAMMIIQIIRINKEISLNGSHQVVNNSVYIFIMLLPYIFIMENKWDLITGVIILSIMYYVIQSSKRGAFIAGLTLLIIYFYYKIKTNINRQNIKNVIPVIIMIVSAIWFIKQQYYSNEYFVNRISGIFQGDSSGRNRIFIDLVKSWYYSDNEFIILFGYGFAGSVKITNGSFAHNDWLELLSNFGIVGIIVYLGLFILVLTYTCDKRIVYNKRINMFALFAVWLLVSLYSMWYTSFCAFIHSILLGYLVGSKKSAILYLKKI